ncbi:MAG: DUF2283 domain-containing protein [Myxococcota bacterium]|jgi:uncharacterized protein YuzE|nr:DUF2283 domain-containing protein [Myxococcota bacterium]
MRVAYDERTDTVTVVFKEDVAVAETDEERPGVILDFDARGELVSIEILDASKRMTDATRVDFEAR